MTSAGGREHRVGIEDASRRQLSGPRGALGDPLARLRATPKAPPPRSWRAITVHPVGGLTDTGYAPDSDLLLVISHDGCGVFDALTGECQTGDRQPLKNARHDPVHLVATASALADQRIRIGGLRVAVSPDYRRRPDAAVVAIA